MMEVVESNGYFYLIADGRTWKFRYPTREQAHQVRDRMEAGWAKHPEQRHWDIRSDAFIGADDICTTVDEKFRQVKLSARG